MAGRAHTGIRIEIPESNVSANSRFRLRFRPLDLRDTVLWVEMDHRQKEWSNKVDKERYVVDSFRSSYFAIIYVCCNRPIKL